MKKLRIRTSSNKKKKSLIRMIFDIVGYVIFSIIFILILVVAIQSFTGHQPNVFGYCYYYIETSSMDGGEDDSFKAGSVIISKMIDEKDCYNLKVNDIITFTPSETNLPSYVTTKTHRIVDIDTKTQTIITKGDANESNDTPISFKDVKAKFIKKSNFLGGFYRLISSFWGFAFLIFIPLVVLIIMQIYSMILAKKSEDIKTENDQIESNMSIEEKKKKLEEEAIKEYLEKMNKKDGAVKK